MVVVDGGRGEVLSGPEQVWETVCSPQRSLQWSVTEVWHQWLPSQYGTLQSFLQ